MPAYRCTDTFLDGCNTRLWSMDALIISTGPKQEAPVQRLKRWTGASCFGPVDTQSCTFYINRAKAGSTSPTPKHQKEVQAVWASNPIIEMARRDSLLLHFLTPWCPSSEGGTQRAERTGRRTRAACRIAGRRKHKETPCPCSSFHLCWLCCWWWGCRPPPVAHGAGSTSTPTTRPCNTRQQTSLMLQTSCGQVERVGQCHGNVMCWWATERYSRGSSPGCGRVANYINTLCLSNYSTRSYVHQGDRTALPRCPIAYSKAPRIRARSCRGEYWLGLKMRGDTMMPLNFD
eukprot:gene2528-biopygen50